MELALEVRREEALADGGTDLVEGPEATSVQFFVRGADGAVVGRAVHIDQFSLAGAVENVFLDKQR